MSYIFDVASSYYTLRLPNVCICQQWFWTAEIILIQRSRSKYLKFV